MTVESHIWKATFVHYKVYHELSFNSFHIIMSLGITAETWKDIWWDVHQKDIHLASTTVGPSVTGLNKETWSWSTTIFI